jgi:hypothetical protein
VTLEATDSDGAKGSTTVPIDRPPTIASDTSLTANCSSGVRPGDTATIQGMLTNAPAGSPVTIELTDPHGTTQTIPVTTTASGIYITSLNPSILGTWRVFTRFAGSPSRNASSAVCAFVVAPAGPGPDPTATSLLCPAAPAQYRQFGIAVPLNGNITPSPVSSSNTMVLEFLKPDGTLMHANAVIAASGDFQYAFDSNAALGEWRVTAMFDGTSAFASSQSQPCEFQIVPGPK